MYEIFEKLLKMRGITAYRVAKDTGITTATLTNWKNGKYTPKQDKMKIIADYFGVTVDYLMTGEEIQSEENHYYINDEARDMAQFMFSNPEYKVLFDASRKVKKEDIEFVKEMIDRMSDK